MDFFGILSWMAYSLEMMPTIKSMASLLLPKIRRTVIFWRSASFNRLLSGYFSTKRPSQVKLDSSSLFAYFQHSFENGRVQYKSTADLVEWWYCQWLLRLMSSIKRGWASCREPFSTSSTAWASKSEKLIWDASSSAKANILQAKVRSIQHIICIRFMGSRLSTTEVFLKR